MSLEQNNISDIVSEQERRVALFRYGFYGTVRIILPPAKPVNKMLDDIEDYEETRT